MQEAYKLSSVPEIAKPFRVGRCQECHLKIQIKTGQLCSTCETYANQDYASRRGDPLFGNVLENLDASVLAATPNRDSDSSDNSFWSSVIATSEETSFNRRLWGAGLTPQQRQIMKLIFLKGQTFFAISKTIGIPVGSVKVQYRRAIKKLKICIPNPVLVRGQEATPTQTTQQLPPPKQIKHGPIRIYAPDQSGQLCLQKLIPARTPLRLVTMSTATKTKAMFHRSCPRCEAKAFCVDRDFQYCMDCLWNSDSDSHL